MIGYVYIAKDKNNDLRLFLKKPSIMTVEKTKIITTDEQDHYGHDIHKKVGTGEYEEVLGYRKNFEDLFEIIEQGTIINKELFNKRLIDDMKYGDEPIVLDKLFS